MTEFRTLYIDMNSFFASVEQQVDPSLRGKPVGITAVNAESGCVVAASYEAKAFGVRTGTRVYEARRLCPNIIFKESRHRLYVRVNQRIAAVLDRYAELERIRSVDEFQIALGGTTARLEGAIALTKQLKAVVRANVGSQMRFSAGIGPNHLLAKIAGKLEKPDGLSWLSRENMPEALAHMQLDDLPGISRGIKARLWKACIWDIPAMYNLDPRHARKIWGSVEGERFVRALQGEDVPLVETTRNGYGNSKVLSPENKTINNAYHVSRWLIEKSGHRLRRDGYTATHFSVFMRFDPEGGWKGGLKTHPTQDTLLFLNLNKHLWRRMYDARQPHKISSIGVHLGGVQTLERRSGEMLLPLDAGKANSSEKLGAIMDSINGRFGTGMVKYGINKPHLGFFDKG